MEAEKQTSSRSTRLSEEDLSSLDYYLKVCAILRRPELFGVKPGQLGSGAVRRERLEFLSSRFSNCRIFSIQPMTFLHICRSVGDVINKKLAAIEKEQPEEGEDEDATSLRKFVVLSNAGSRAKFPDRLPFDDCAILYGEGVNLTKTLLSMRIPENLLDEHNIEGGILHAHVIFKKEQSVWELLSVWKKDAPVGDPRFGIIPIEIYDTGVKTRAPMAGLLEGLDNDVQVAEAIKASGWSFGYTMVPWALNTIVDILHDNRPSLVPAGSMTMRLAWKRALKGSKMKARESPPSFYPIVINPENPKAYYAHYVRALIPKEIFYTHRWDVIGHERLKLHRGPLPLDPLVEEKLKKQEYRICLTALSEEDSIRLKRRNIEPQAPGEWIALKVIDVTPHVRGPEDKPYVPAMRILQGEKNG